MLLILPFTPMGIFGVQGFSIGGDSAVKLLSSESAPALWK